jgi:transposase InsO family protein
VLRARSELKVGPHPIGWQLGLAASTVQAILKRHGRSRLKQRPLEPVIRYERERPGELIHIDVKKLGRIKRRRHPVSGRLVGARGHAGYDYLFVCVDDHTRLAHARLYPEETTAAALAFLDSCRRFYTDHSIELEEVLTDNGKCFQRKWETGCRERELKPRHTRVRRPQTNGKAERFIQTLIRDWLHARLYTDNQQRTAALDSYLDRYNHRRRHRSLNGQTPAQRASTTSLGHTPGSGYAGNQVRG